MSLASALQFAASAADEDRLTALRQHDAVLASGVDRDSASMAEVSARMSRGSIRTPSDGRTYRHQHQQPVTGASSVRPTRRHHSVAPSFLVPHSHPLAASSIAAAAASSHKSHDRFASNLKATDPYSLAQYIEEARIAYQYGKYTDALTIYSYLEGLKVTVPNLGFHISWSVRTPTQAIADGTS
jgi:hypothetical protein